MDDIKPNQYAAQTPMLVSIDCIVFGFDGENLRILLTKRGLEPGKGRWSLTGGFVGQKEDLERAAARVLHELTGLKNVYLEQLKTYGEPLRDPFARTICVAYFALIDIRKYQDQPNHEGRAKWFSIDEAPPLIFDQNEMVNEACRRVRYKAALHPLLFELLPQKFTIPQLQNLYEQVYGTPIDNRNFIRKVSSTGLLVKLQEKDKSGSRRGAFYFRLDRKKYRAKFQSFLNFIPNPDHLLG
ncbi:DNA mismatch repair protein MutT [Pedobacter yulinensis]|uniref:DNA mismatch repair protein MutT n=1 Tax=Pedobacter yulinensis TaxID=2126353 RepID=A0A2T3HK61_9SPHI|nr:NUDIX domain-containing protein [Pedobacter yulinensis]PST82845.1 DNA mismatch repair protein MutT [Pedobacter yulinensis]